ncbi:hypothetical protein [Streptomyces bicolor]|uniref:hypothetical protein n=1 Tax=Streptomyces bicolor TaxID=66874 RepID=UPI000A42122F|nr:hypothetical protein [Streptomyces bicolor]
MTSATFSRTRTMSGRRMRVAAVAASLAGALTLTACSGDGDSDSGPTPTADARPSASASASADTGGGTGGSGSAADGLDGSWLATTKGGKAVALMVNGTEAGLFATGGTVCSGTVGKEDGGQVIRLKCTDGSKDRATGTVRSVGKESLTVTWGGFGSEAYTRAEGGSLPSGLPTAGLGS